MAIRPYTIVDLERIRDNAQKQIVNELRAELCPPRLSTGLVRVVLENASAPAMLAELESVRDDLALLVKEQLQLESYDFTRIDAVIAKARGVTCAEG